MPRRPLFASRKAALTFLITVIPVAFIGLALVLWALSAVDILTSESMFWDDFAAQKGGMETIVYVDLLVTRFELLTAEDSPPGNPLRMPTYFFSNGIGGLVLVGLIVLGIVLLWYAITRRGARNAAAG